MYFNAIKSNKIIVGTKIVIGDFCRNAISFNGSQTEMSIGDKSTDTKINGKTYIDMTSPTNIYVGNNIIMKDAQENNKAYYVYKKYKNLSTYGSTLLDNELIGKTVDIAAYSTDSKDNKTKTCHIYFNSDTSTISIYADRSIYLGASKLIKLSNVAGVAYGTTLPTTNNEEGRIFFKLVN